MRQRAVVGRRLRRGKRTTNPDPAAPAVADLLGRDFTGSVTGSSTGHRHRHRHPPADRLVTETRSTRPSPPAVAGPRRDLPQRPRRPVRQRRFRRRPATATAYAAPRAASAHRSATPSRRRSSPPSNENLPSTIDAGTPSTTTAVATPPSATAARRSTNSRPHYRSRHNPVSTPRGKPALPSTQRERRHAARPNSVSTNTVNVRGQGTRSHGAVPATPPHRSGSPRRRRTGPPR